MRTTLHDRYRCAQNADHFAHNTPFSLFFAEVVCALGTTPTKATQGLSPNGGIALHEAPTRRRHAARGLHVVQNPHERGHGGRRRDRRAWPRRRRDRKAGLRGAQAAVPVAGKVWPDNEPKRRSKLAARTDRGADGRSGRHRHHRQPNFARNLSRSFFEMPQTRCNSNDANSMFESVVEELRAELLVDSHSWASGQRTEPTHRAADRSSRHGRLAGRPRCSPAPRPGPAPIKPAGPQATASVTQQHVVSYNPSVILGA